MIKGIKEKEFGSQNFLCLMMIPAAAVGIPQIRTGEHLALKYGAGTALCSIFVGNLLVWLIAVGVIAMMEQMHVDAIENIKRYFGRIGGVLAAFFFLVAFLNWYALQINTSIELLMSKFSWGNNWGMVLRLGAGLGLLSALLSVGGLSLLKRLSFVGLPLFICYQVYAMAVSNRSVVFEETWGLSFPAVLVTMVLTFPVVIMLPTLFRYSKSNAHSYLALVLFTLVITFFQVSSIWVDFSQMTSLWMIFIVVIVLKLTCCNLFNIYLASSCWEAMVPKFTAAKEHAIIGLIGTLVYTFVQISSPVNFLQAIMGEYLACLGLVLLIAYLMRVMIQHRPRPLEQSISIAAWLFGCLMGTIHEVRYFPHSISGLLVAITSSFLFFLTVLFIEETVWSIQMKMNRRRL